MDPIAFATLALKVLPLLVQAGEDIAPLVERALAALGGTADPAPEDWDALHATEARLRAALNAPTVAT